VRRDGVVAKLRAHEAELRSPGVEALHLFGSVERDEAGDGSDVDLLYDRARLAPARVWDDGDIKDTLRAIVGRDVDLITRHISYPRLRARIEASLVPVF
jgi:predicted nucleotidyltransferase